MRFPPFFISGHLYHQQTNLPGSNHILLDYKNHEGRDMSVLFTKVFSAPSVLPDPL